MGRRPLLAHDVRAPGDRRMRKASEVWGARWVTAAQ